MWTGPKICSYLGLLVFSAHLMTTEAAPPTALPHSYCEGFFFSVSFCHREAKHVLVRYCCMLASFYLKNAHLTVCIHPSTDFYLVPLFVDSSQVFNSFISPFPAVFFFLFCRFPNWYHRLSVWFNKFARGLIFLIIKHANSMCAKCHENMHLGSYTKSV